MPRKYVTPPPAEYSSFEEPPLAVSDVRKLPPFSEAPPPSDVSSNRGWPTLPVRVMKLTTPLTADDPYMALCGPRATSTRSTLVSVTP